jgi:hypothetical protein
MKKTFLFNMLGVFAVGISLTLAFPLLSKAADNTPSSGGALKDDDTAEEDSGTTSGSSIELLNKAHALLTQFSALGSTTAKAGDRKKLLVQARKLIWKVAPDEAVYKGTRKEASLDILAALKELRQDTPDETSIADHIRRADSELRSAISAGAKVTATASQ